MLFNLVLINDNINFKAASHGALHNRTNKLKYNTQKNNAQKVCF